MLRSLGTLYERGAAVEWSRIHASAGRSCASLPSYPWQRERHWISPKPATLDRFTSRHGHPLLGERVRLAPSGDVGFWESSLSPSTPGFLADHRVQGQVVVPGAAYLEMVLATAVDHEISAPVELVDVAFTEALNLATDEPRVVQTIVDTQGLGRSRFRVVSQAPGPDDSNSSWCTHATGRVRPAAAPEAAVDLHALRERLDRALEGPAFYARLARAGMAYGHAFQTIEQLWCGEGEALARVRATAAGGDGAAAYRFHPAVLDGCMQVLAAAVDDDTGRAVAVPSEIAELGIYARPGAELWCHARLTRSESERLWGRHRRRGSIRASHRQASRARGSTPRYSGVRPCTAVPGAAVARGPAGPDRPRGDQRRRGLAARRWRGWDRHGGRATAPDARRPGHCGDPRGPVGRRRGARPGSGRSFELGGCLTLGLSRGFAPPGCGAGDRARGAMRRARRGSRPADGHGHLGAGPARPGPASATAALPRDPQRRGGDAGRGGQPGAGRPMGPTAQLEHRAPRAARHVHRP